MTFVVPNYFLEEQPQNVISSDGLFTVTYSSKRNNNAMLVRNTSHVMILLTKGSKRLQFEGNDIVLREGSIFFLSQGNYVMSEVLSKDGLYEAIMVYFDDTFVLEFLKSYSVDVSRCKSDKVAVFSTDGLLRDLMHSFADYLPSPLKHKDSIVKLKTEEIFLHILSEQHETFCAFLRHILDSTYNRVCHILEENLDIIESVEDMTRITRLNKQELRKKVLASTGLTPKSWLDKKRLEQAATQLQYSDENIISIATSCGYSTASWFGVQFKKAYGVTPKMYRAQNR